ncbi:hypothetical protein ACFL6Z_06705 [Pseudomonadota bacterium]|uniref:hypothetical protein n=1 Tax=unclassified Shewanella TaxID=196818 RepID=UPI000C84F12C|nr:MULTISPECIES: hypothetical protein [unclassified Shewanella]MDO6775997.1 hypothetical protein [Shewanella sp. 3_MG-2023]PMG30831.1 hypothetical protein BCU94_10270 [Shewanella sp. 10N.286.52.C2]
MKKYLAIAVLGALSFNAAAEDDDDLRPGKSTIAIKWEHKLLDGRTDRPKVEFGHRMRNGFKFGVEQAWQYDRSKSEKEVGFAPEQYELTFKTDYQTRWGDNNEHQAGPVLDYQTKETANSIRFGGYYGYKINSDWQVKVRARYSQHLDRISLKDDPADSYYRDDKNKEMRYDMWLTYRWDNFRFVYNLIHYSKISSYKNDSGVEQHVYSNGDRSLFEHEFTANYRFPHAKKHTVYGKFKLKTEMLKDSHMVENSGYDWYGKRDNAIELGYKYSF